MNAKFILTLTFSGNLLFSLAQVGKISTEYPWKVSSANENIFNFKQFQTLNQKGIVYQGDSTAFVPVRFVSGDMGVIRVNSNAVIGWQYRVPGNIVGLAWIGKNIVAFSAPDQGSGSTDLTAALLDPVSGKKIKEKRIYQDNSEYWADIKIVCTPDGQFNNALVRTTPYKGKASWVWNKGRSSFQTTDKLNIIWLADNLDIVKNLERNDLLKDMDFTGCFANTKHELFLYSHRGEDFVVQKISNDGKSLQSIKTRVKPADDRYVIHIADEQDNQDPEHIFIALSSYEHGDPVLHNLLFDFTKNTVLAPDPVVMNKAFKKSVEMTAAPNVRSADMGAKYLSPIAVTQTDEKFIVMQEMEGTSVENMVPVTNTQTVIVSFYDKNLRSLKDLGIDRAFSFYWSTGASVGYHIRGNKLELLLAANTSRENYQNLRATIDISKMTMDGIRVSDPIDGNRRRFAEGAATFWFHDGYIQTNVITKGLSALETHSILQNQSY